MVVVAETGAYFLRHIKGSEAKQVFISSSEDLMHLHVWPNYYDKADKKVRCVHEDFFLKKNKQINK